MLPCCPGLPCPCCCPSPTGMFAAQLGVDPVKAQGLDDCLKSVWEKIGCARTKDVAQTAFFQSAKQAFPLADPDCLAASIQGMITAIAESVNVLFTHGPANFIAVLIQKISQPLSQFIGCVFGADASARFDTMATPYTFGARALPGIVTCLMPIISSLLPVLLGCAGGGQPRPGGGLCPPIGGQPVPGGGLCPPMPSQPPPQKPPVNGCCMDPGNPTPGPSPGGGWAPNDQNRCS